jgi:hypothetical protein
MLYLSRVNGAGSLEIQLLVAAEYQSIEKFVRPTIQWVQLSGVRYDRR